MKKIASTLLLLSVMLPVFGQEDAVWKKREGAAWKDKPQEVKPTFMGGDTSLFREWVHQRLAYPEDVRAEGIGGRVTLSFTVETDGSVDKVEVLRGLDPRLDAEAVRVVASSPKWTPYIFQGEVRPMPYIFPVFFFPIPREQVRYGPGDWDLVDIYCICHGTLMLKVGKTKILVDPLDEYKGEKLSYDIDNTHISDVVVLLTHEHGDHLCPPLIEEYTHDGEERREVRVIANKTCHDVLAAKGNSYLKLTKLDNGQTAVIDAMDVRYNGIQIKITAVPAYNTTEGREMFHPRGSGNGYLVEVGDARIYISGDTEPIPAMKDLGKVDIAFLAVNQPYTMTPEQCIEAAKMIGPAVLIPYHLGSTDIAPIIESFAGSKTEVRIHEELR